MRPAQLRTPPLAPDSADAISNTMAPRTANRIGMFWSFAFTFFHPISKLTSILGENAAIANRANHWFPPPNDPILCFAEMGHNTNIFIASIEFSRGTISKSARGEPS